MQFPLATQYFLLPLVIILFSNSLINCNSPLCRSVADEQRTLALGVQSVFFRVFGAVPGPIAFGAVIDSGCVYWQYECNRRGNCWVYDNHLLGYRAFAIAISGLAMTVVFYIISWIFYPPVKCLSTVEPEDEDSDGKKAETSSNIDTDVDVFVDNKEPISMNGNVT